jgi:hypothetical protein
MVTFLDHLTVVLCLRCNRTPTPAPTSAGLEMHCQKRRSVAFGAMADKFVCKGSANAQKTKNFAVVSALLAVAQTAHPTPIATLPML